MEDNITREEKGKWFDELLALQERIADENIKTYIGNTYRVICDSHGSRDGYMSGHTNGTASIDFKGDESMLGKFITVKVTNTYSNVLCGTIITE